eukprot:4880170-Pyramimonas_sp.AAC.1
MLPTVIAGCPGACGGHSYWGQRRHLTLVMQLVRCRHDGRFSYTGVLAYRVGSRTPGLEPAPSSTDVVEILE